MQHCRDAAAFKIYPTQKNTEEGKIIVYTTSFRGVRHTYEECKYILTVFHNLRVRVQERDIYAHKFYHRELEERLEGEYEEQLPVPQVYINGQHVGVSRLVFKYPMNLVHFWFIQRGNLMLRC